MNLSFSLACLALAIVLSLAAISVSISTVSNKLTDIAEACQGVIQ